MNFKQKLLKAFYPLIMRLTGSPKKEGQVKENAGHAVPPIPFYSLQATLNNGDTFDFSGLKGKKVLLVNTASNCGYTAQFGELESLYEKYKDRLAVIGFPANDFKEQEKGSDAEIAEFCKVNFGVSFPLMRKSVVVRGDGQNPVYRWLTDPSKNGWNTQEPVWNFCKYLIDERGVLTHYFAMSVSPASPEVIAAVKGHSV
ncbi:MAG: glutathione peroxidase [Puia sp.]|nr:glutathione peroxidase [Puia sp.]